MPTHLSCLKGHWMVLLFHVLHRPEPLRPGKHTGSRVIVCSSFFLRSHLSFMSGTHQTHWMPRNHKVGGLPQRNFSMAPNNSCYFPEIRPLSSARLKTLDGRCQNVRQSAMGTLNIWRWKSRWHQETLGTMHQVWKSASPFASSLESGIVNARPLTFLE